MRDRPRTEAIVAVALVSFCILAVEIALTRLFSVLFRAPYVFLIVSGAIGGLGAGGLAAQWMRPRDEKLPQWITWLCITLAAALASPVLLLFVAPPGRALVADAETTVVILLPMLLFAVGGAALALLFRRYADHLGELYAWDLAAAAAAAPLSVLLLNHLGGINTPLLLSALAAGAALILALRSRLAGATTASGVALAAALALLGSNLAANWITLPALQPPAGAKSDPSHDWWLRTKPLFAELADPFNSSRIVRTDWTAVSRTDVVHDPASDVYYIYTDGDVPTQMEPLEGDLASGLAQYGNFIGLIPFALQRAAADQGQRGPREVMAIGSGGGLDVMLALGAGAERVDAVEINPSIPAIVRDPRFQHTYAQVYKDPRVRLVVDEGRSFLQRAGRYDVIYFACAKTATTQTSGVALLDNHLYTVEAFRQYRDHLQPGGIAALVTQEAHLIDRLFVTALTALRNQGVSRDQAPLHLMTARVTDQGMAMGPYRYILMMRRNPWSSEESRQAVQGLMGANLIPLFVPHLLRRAASGEEFNPDRPPGEVQRELEQLWSSRVPPGGIQLSAVTDDSPFYADIAKTLHPFLGQILIGVSVATILVFLLVGIGGRRMLRESPRAERAALPPLMAAFFLLGAGFMLVELALMQRFLLLLGFPTFTLSVSLFALLLAGAAGSRLSQTWPPVTARRYLQKLLPLLALLLGIYIWVLPTMVQAGLAWPLPLRILLAVLLLLPPGLAMGMPFPSLLRLLPPALQDLTPAFWSINGVASIFGSVLTMAIAKFWGYSGALAAGAACYLLIALILRSLRSLAPEEDDLRETAPAAA